MGEIFEIPEDLLVYLEEETDTEPDNNAGYLESNGKDTLMKLSKFDLQYFYGDSEMWISFKKLFISPYQEMKTCQILKSCNICISQ